MGLKDYSSFMAALLGGLTMHSEENSRSPEFVLKKFIVTDWSVPRISYDTGLDGMQQLERFNGDLFKCC